MNRLRSSLNQNNIIITLTVISTCLLHYNDLISAVIITVSTCCLLNLYFRIKKYKTTNIVINTFVLIYFAIEIIALSILFFYDVNFTTIAFLCTIIISLKLSITANEDHKFIMKLIFLFIVIMISMFFLSLYNARGNIEFEFIMSEKIIYSICSIFCLCVASSKVFEIDKKELNNGFLVGSLIYISLIGLMNYIFSTSYIFDSNPINKINELMPFYISPLSEWGIIVLICFRESIFIKYAYNVLKRLRRN